MDSPYNVRVKDVFPKIKAVDVPESTPDAAANVFKQAVESLNAGHLDAACGMFRRTMELALKAFSPEIAAWQLEKRIDKMAAENKITVDIKDWAHELRLDGNKALHGDEPASFELADQMHNLCKFLLIYLYTLPAQVAAAKARRAT